MLNLDNIKTNTMEIALNKKLIKVQEPTVKLIKKLQGIENNEDLDIVLNVLVDILNNNTSNIKLKNTDLENLNNKQLNLLVEEIGKFINGIEEDPN